MLILLAFLLEVEEVEDKKCLFFFFLLMTCFDTSFHITFEFADILGGLKIDSKNR